MRRIVALLIFLGLIAAGYAAAPPIEIRNAWSPATPPVSAVAAVYLEIEADQEDTLLGASTDIAAKTEIHETLEEEGAMRMHELEAVKVSPGNPVIFDIGGKHLMLRGLKQPLQAPRHFRLTLHFEKAGDIPVEVRVVTPADYLNLPRQ